MIRPLPRSIRTYTLVPYTTLFRSAEVRLKQSTSSQFRLEQGLPFGKLCSPLANLDCQIAFGCLGNGDHAILFIPQTTLGKLRTLGDRSAQQYEMNQRAHGQNAGK